MIFLKSHFSWLIAFLCCALFIFNFWLFYPGYLAYDWERIMGVFPLDNWQPVIYPFLLKKITNIFGYHIYYPLLFNLIPFYLGIYFIVWGCWKKFQSAWCLLGFFPVFIGNIFFINIMAHSSVSSPMFIFLLWSILFYQLLNGITRINMVLAGAFFVFAVLSRHNALIQAYPVLFVYSWLIVQKLKPSFRLLKYITLLFLFAIMTIMIPIGTSWLLRDVRSYPANHIFLHQIAGVCVPNHDKSCFKLDWYRAGKNFSNVEKEFYMNPLSADGMIFLPNSPFPLGRKLDGISRLWITSILKYPSNYIQYINHFRKKIWHVDPLLGVCLDLTREEHCIRKKRCERLKDYYSHEELFYKAPQLKINVYNFFKKFLFVIPTFCFVILNFILLGIIGFLFFKKKNVMLLYSLSSCIAAIFGSIIFCIFMPAIINRYIYPVLISTIITIIGLVTSIVSCRK